MDFDTWWKKEGIEFATLEEKMAAMKGWTAALKASSALQLTLLIQKKESKSIGEANAGT